MSMMFGYCGYIAMESLDLGTQFNTINVTNMDSMFEYCGYTAMKSLDLSSGTNATNTTQFNTSNVESMIKMFMQCGNNAMITLNLGNNFDTGKVTNMNHMFNSTGYEEMTSLNLGIKFNTSEATDMNNMFGSTGGMSMTTLILGDKFDTSKVTNMNRMFRYCGGVSLTSLDLGDKFYTTSVTDMEKMFADCGNAAMTTLDLGPAFTRIADTNTDFITNCGKKDAVTGERNCTIYVSEQIYKDMVNLKLNTDSTTSITYVTKDESGVVTGTRGTINPIYKPEWSKVSSSLNESTGIMTVVVKGTANKTFTNGDYTGTYLSDVTSKLPIPEEGQTVVLTGEQADLINVYVDGELSKLDTNSDGTLDTETIVKTITSATSSTNATTGKTEVQYTITLDLEDSIRRSGKNFLEWSGNVSLQFTNGTLIDKYGSYLTTETQTDEEGNSVDVTVPVVNVFADEEGNYVGNGNRAEIDVGTTTDASGNHVPEWDKTLVEDENAPLSANTDTTEANMFSDTIEPEFTYQYHNTVIDYANNKVTIGFDVTDKYFASTTLATDTTGANITVRVDGDVDANTAITKALSKTAIFVMNKETKEITSKAIDYEIPDTEQKVGERYELVIRGLESSNGVGYSGPMTLAFPAGTITDKSGNTNPAKTITIGIEEPNTPYIPDGYKTVNGTNLANGFVIEDPLGNQYVWIEVPKTSKVYPTAGLDITEYSDDDYEKIEDDLQNYTETYRSTSTDDIASENEDATGLSADEYNLLKKKMLKSIYINGGFYVGRYETGTTETYRTETSEGTIDETPIIQANAYPYNHVTLSEAQTLSNKFTENLEGYTSNLMFGVQWDLILKYLEEKGVNQDNLTTSSLTWGNYLNSNYTITNTNAKIIGVEVEVEAEIPYTHESGTKVLLTTGASDAFSKQNISDLAGNMNELTLEKSVSSDLFVVRGGCYAYDESNRTIVKYRGAIGASDITTEAYTDVGFRVALYKDEGTGEDSETTNKEEIVDVVNPIWSYADSEIDRENKEVNIYIIGSDKYYKENTLDEGDITVYVDGSATTVDTDRDGTADGDVTRITKTLTDVTAEMMAEGNEERLAELIAGAGLTSSMTADNNLTAVGVIYKLTLSTFGTISGETEFVIAADTIEDTSGNKNLVTEKISVGNVTWTEQGDNATTPRYPAFRNDVVDFIKPTINYTYSTVEGSENPDIDYVAKTVTVKFTVTDKYLLESDLIKTVEEVIDNGDGTTTTITKQIPKNINIIVDGTTVYDSSLETQTTQVTTSISEVDIANGKEYTLVVSNIQQTNENQPTNTTPENGDGFDFSGPMQLVFTAGVIDDTSGNKNDEKTITLDTEIGSDIVDVVDPIIYYSSSQRNSDKTVTLTLKATDKYLDTATSQTNLNSAINNIKVKVVDEYGNTIVNDTTTISKEIVQLTTLSQEIIYKISLSNFGVYEGKTSVIIPEDVVKDTSGNGNVETEILVGNPSDGTAFKDSIVDFTKPTWEYVTSTINRTWDEDTDRRLENGELGTNNPNGTVTLEVKGTDIYFDKDTYFTNSTLDLTQVKVYINDVENTNVTKEFATNADGTIKKEYIEETKGLAAGYSRVFKGVKYTIILGNFEANEEDVRIEIPLDTIKDTSLNGNILTPIEVGNSEWVEEDEPLEPTNPNYPKYRAFRSDIVDFIKPVIEYQYVENTNPKLDRTNETVDITFTVTDHNFLESNIGLGGMKIYIDDMQVYGTDVKTSVDISANLSEPETITNGLKYTLTLLQLELNGYIEDVDNDGELDEGEDINGNGQLDTLTDMFERHSGVIKIVFAEDQVYDTSGNPNNETTIIVDNGDGDDLANGVIVDFVNPNIYYKDKYINWEDRYALITVRATDRFYDNDTELKVSDIKLYQLNEETGQYIEITNIPDDDITISTVANAYGQDFIIRIDNFEEEFKMKINIAGGTKDADGTVLTGIGDTSGNVNDETDIYVDLDNRKPSWKYVSTDTTNFESAGTISFNVKGVDKFLDLGVDDEGIEKSKLEKTDITILKDGVDITNVNNITVALTATDEDEKSKSYKIDVTGLSGTGTYTLVLADGTLIDIFGNESAATTISFSNSAISTNTGNYVKVTYHVTPDMETVHSSYVHELISANETGTNYNTAAQMANATYTPSSLGEIFNNGKNPLFAEPLEEPVINGYTITSQYSPKSFAGWAVCDENGIVADGATVYGLYEEIPITVTNLKAVWQDATVVFVSNTTGDNSNNGQFGTPVKDLTTAYSLINTTATGTVTNNIIVIMDAIEWSGNTTLTGSATITSVYGGVDYRSQGAELKVSSNMVVNGDITFDNIKLYATSTTISNGTDYLGNGTYTNMLISNYSGDIILGRGITTPTTNYTFGAIVGGNFKTETSTGELDTHTIRVEAGKYNNIIAGSTLADDEATTETKSITHEVVIGNMRDTAVSVNDKLTITGYVAIGENEQKCYPSGATNSNTAADEDYANVTLYSGTITAVNKFTKATENSAIYLRSINGQTDGQMNFEMYGGIVNANIYGGARVASVYETQNFNTINIYGGQLTGHIFGQSANDTFTGGTTITIQGNFGMTGNIYGGSNVTTTSNSSVGAGNSNITIYSVTINGNIYGGGNMVAEGTGFITGNTEITLESGTVLNIYGGGYNLGNTGTATILMENGTVSGNIYGGAYHNQVRTSSDITVLGGTVSGSIYGGNDNIESQLEDDTYFQNVNITIGDTDATKSPTVNGTIYGGGKYDKVDTATIELIECTNATTIYGGSNTDATTLTADIYLKGMTVNNIYGGGQSAGIVAVANIYLQSGTVTDVYGGGFATDVTESHITLEGTATATSIYGGSNTSGTVTTSNVTLKSGSVTNVFGGGNSAAVGTANVTLDGITIGSIHGGSKDAGVTTTTNVILKSGTVGEVFGGGLDVGVTTANVKQQGATVTTIYGGNNSGTGTGGDTVTTNIEILNSTVGNVYGGNKEKGTTRYANINIHGTSTITGKLYGGGYKSAIGKGTIVTDENGNVTGVTLTEEGKTTINIAGGTINGDINGGSEESTVYGNTNINIGQDATVSVNSALTPGNINIIGTIYGAGNTLTEGTPTVAGNTNITMDNSTNSPIQYFTADSKEKSIYGSGKGGAIYTGTIDAGGNVTDNSTIHIKDFGTAGTPYLFKSIEDTGKLYIGASVIELVGNRDETIGNYYTLNTITRDLTIYSNTTLYTQRGFNKVGGFYSYVNKTSTKATVTITDGVATTNTNGANKLYTLEGINLIFARKEVTLANKSTLTMDDWGEVSGMAYFGTYKNTLTGKQYDLDLFRAGTYVEGQYNQYHNINTDGFYTTVDNSGTEIAQIIDTVNYTNYCDWIINAPTVNYDVNLIASTYGKQSVAELLLNYKYASDYTYAAETVYTLNKVSTNALKPGIELVDPKDPTKLPTVSANANNKFGLTMETTNSGWKEQALTTIYSSSNGSYTGDSEYKSDAQTTAGKLKFKVHNSLNITEQKDLGNVNIVLTGQQPLNEGGSESYTFKVVIAVNLQTLVDELKEQYTPSFTDKVETQLSYTADSRVDLSYLLYNNMESTPYASGDYRVISTTVQLPAGTKITLKDYGQGDSVNKVYYYQIPTNTSYDATITVDGTTRYLYKLSNFTEIGSTDSKYVDSTTYYHTTEKYVLEKYDISIDFINSGIDADKLAQETYLELRDSAGNVKYDNGDTTIKYNLYKNKNAAVALTESNNTNTLTYSVVDTIEIPMTISASILEQSGILDTKYHDQIAGIAIQIVDGQNVRIKSPELQNFKLKNLTTGTEYSADVNGVIRMPIIEGLGSMSGDYKLSITQANVPSGVYTVQVKLITADDGKYYGTVPEIQKTFNITFVNKMAGLVGVQSAYDARIINKSTGLNLVEGSDTSKAVDMTITVQNPSNETNIRVELYKRNPTYTNVTDETTYTETSYTLVDISQYLQGTWEKPEDHGLVSPTGSKEYIVSPKKTYATPVALETIEFEKAITNAISTGEYKLVFKAYSNNTLVQEVRKTFIVTK